MEDFSSLSKAALEAKKKREDQAKQQDKAKASAQHTVLRKQHLPPTESDLRKFDKKAKEIAFEDNEEANKRTLRRVKRACNKFKARWPERLDNAGFPKPAAKASLEEWEQFLSDMQDELGSAHAEDSFNRGLAFIVSQIEGINKARPDLFAGYNIHHPVSLTSVLTSPEALNEIADERSEIVILHERWFSQGHWSRLGFKLVAIAAKVSEANAGHARADAKKGFASAAAYVDPEATQPQVPQVPQAPQVPQVPQAAETQEVASAADSLRKRPIRKKK